MMIRVDYHPSFQQIAFLTEETGEYSERRLNHSDGAAETFYRDLKLRGVHVRVGMEATGYSRWFGRLLAELGSKCGSAISGLDWPSQMFTPGTMRNSLRVIPAVTLPPK